MDFINNKFNSPKGGALDVDFTKDQYIAYTNLIDFINNPFEPKNNIRGLCGAGGVGKTFLIKYLIEHCKYSSNMIKCATPTHTACRLLSVSLGGKTCHTIQSVLGLRLDINLEDFDPDNPQFNPIGEHKLANTILLIIDEASMLPSKLTYYLIKKAKEYEIKIIFSGDSYQLFPIGERSSTAFKVCNKIYYLTQLVRQNDNNPIVKLLNQLRSDIDKNSFNFINNIATQPKNQYNFNNENEGFVILNGKDFTNEIKNKFNDEDYGNNVNKYKTIAYTNPVVTSWNNFIRKEIIKDGDKGILTKNDLIMSYVTLVDDFQSVIIENSGQYIINSITNHIDINYSLKGYLVVFKAVFGGYNTTTMFVIDHTDRQTLINYYNSINILKNKALKLNGYKRTEAWKNYYNFKKKYLLLTNISDRNGKLLFSRDLDYGFSITAHKSQGSTYENVFVDLNDMIFDTNGRIRFDSQDLLRRLYVACSRTKKQLYLRYG